MQRDGNLVMQCCYGNKQTARSCTTFWRSMTANSNTFTNGLVQQSNQRPGLCQRPHLTSQVHPGSCYRCGRSTLRAVRGPRQEEKGPEIRAKRFSQLRRRRGQVCESEDQRRSHAHVYVKAVVVLRHGRDKRPLAVRTRGHAGGDEVGARQALLLGSWATVQAPSQTRMRKSAC